MAKTYHSTQHWEHWLIHPLGASVLAAEENFLPHLLTDCYGRHALLIGVPQQFQLLKFSSITYKTLLGPLFHKNNRINYIEGNFKELAIQSASIDLVLLPHTLEIMDNPRQLLSEACRIVKPEGYIVIFGFNPYSLWGLKRKWMRANKTPWKNMFLSANTVSNWLKLADFELVKQKTLVFRPPLENHAKIYKNLKIMEWIGCKLWPPFGGVYMLMAKAKHIPLTPIKLHWKQQLSGVQATLPGHSIRNWQ